MCRRGSNIKLPRLWNVEDAVPYGEPTLVRGGGLPIGNTDPYSYKVAVSKNIIYVSIVSILHKKRAEIFFCSQSAGFVSRLTEFEKPLQAKALNLQKREFTKT